MRRESLPSLSVTMLGGGSAKPRLAKAARRTSGVPTSVCLGPVPQADRRRPSYGTVPWHDRAPRPRTNAPQEEQPVKARQHPLLLAAPLPTTSPHLYTIQLAYRVTVSIPSHPSPKSTASGSGWPGSSRTHGAR
jgi:hypothetical protein